MKEYGHRTVWCIYLGEKRYFALTGNNEMHEVSYMEDAETFLSYEEAEKALIRYWICGRIIQWHKKDIKEERNSHYED